MTNDTPTQAQEREALIAELEAASGRLTQYTNSPLDGLLQAAADALRATHTPSPASGEAARWDAVVALAHELDDAAQHITEWQAYDFATKFRQLAGLDGEVVTAEVVAKANPAAGAEPDMRHILIGQIHNLIDIAERYSRHMHKRGDADERDRIEGEIAHVRKTIAPYTYNGPTRQPAPNERDAEDVLAQLDALSDDAAAHIFPSDLEKCATRECTATVYSVRMGSPDGKTVPLFSREQVKQALIDAARNKEHGA